MKVVVAGGTGFLGSALARSLRADGHDVVVLSRRGRAPELEAAGVRLAAWDARTAGPWASELEGAGAVVNLAGESIAARRWTVDQKARIAISRVEATKALAQAIGRAAAKPGVLVNASAVGFYGDVPEGDVAEDRPKGKGFLADVCDAWETAARSAGASGVRVVTPRFGVVIDRGGGALEKMALPFRLFAGGPVGDGRQWFPWVHRDDAVGAVRFAVETPALSGPVNVAAPEPATNAEFSAALGRALGRPSWLPAPAFALRLALGEMAGMLLTGQKAVPRKLEQAGYRFRRPGLQGALEADFAD